MTRSVGLAAVLLYWLTLAFPISPRLALALLLAAGFLLILPHRAAPKTRSLLLLSVLGIFSALSLLSALEAVDVRHALVVCMSLGPALLLCYLLCAYFEPREVRWLATTLVVTGVTLALYLSVVALTHWADGREQWLVLAGFSQLAVPNDLLFLALLAPYATAGALCARERLTAAGAAIAVLLSVAAMVIFQSRGGPACYHGRCCRHGVAAAPVAGARGCSAGVDSGSAGRRGERV